MNKFKETSLERCRACGRLVTDGEYLCKKCRKKNEQYLKKLRKGKRHGEQG